jgi:RNA polymerase sigma-70 factor (ECF subfamily)
MDEHELLARQFEAERPRLSTVAYRMLGSLGEAEDAVQEAWLRLDRGGAEGIANLGGWLTTVVARVCLDMLRARKARREEPIGPDVPEPVDPADPAREAELAESVGLALLVVLDSLAPAERIAFVLHDMFDLPVAEIARVVGRSPVATRQLASRARRRVRGQTGDEAAVERRRGVVEAFLTAARDNDLAGLLAVLDPDIELRADMPQRLVLLDVGEQLVVLRVSGGGYDGATGSAARARGYGADDIDDLFDVIVRRVHGLTFGAAVGSGG